MSEASPWLGIIVVMQCHSKDSSTPGSESIKETQSAQFNKSQQSTTSEWPNVLTINGEQIILMSAY